MPIEIPPELSVGNTSSQQEASELLQTLRMTQANFKTVHQQVEAVRRSETVAQLDALRNECAKLGSEKTQLEQRVRGVGERFAKDDSPQLRELLSVVRELRNTQEEEEKLRQRREDQSTQLRLREARLDALRAELDSQRDLEHASPQAVLRIQERTLETERRRLEQVRSAVQEANMRLAAIRNMRLNRIVFPAIRIQFYHSFELFLLSDRIGCGICRTNLPSHPNLPKKLMSCDK